MYLDENYAKRSPDVLMKYPTAISGELWAVDDVMFEALNALEGIAYGWYKASEIEVEFKDPTTNQAVGAE